MILRQGLKEDLPQILEIMNYYIEHTTIIFDKQRKTLSDMGGWFEKFIHDYPLIVAMKDNQLLGYAYLSAYRPKIAYKQTVELSIYVSPNSHNRGIGKELMLAMIEEGRRRKYHTILSFITSENEESIRFHEKFDFKEVGKLKEVGNKNNRWLDVSIYQLLLA